MDSPSFSMPPFHLSHWSRIPGPLQKATHKKTAAKKSVVKKATVEAPIE
jgi:hypothetical protein